jgi:hypothetical protein
MEEADIRALAHELEKKGHSTSYARYPNGYRFDVHPEYMADGTERGADLTDVQAAYDKSIGPKYNDYDILPIEIARAKERILRDASRQAAGQGLPEDTARQLFGYPEAGPYTGAGKSAWNTYRQRLNSLAASEKAFRGLAAAVEKGNLEFVGADAKARRPRRTCRRKH